MMTRRFRVCAFLYLLFIACACISCEGSSGGSEVEDVPIATDDRELIGTWAGWFAYGADNHTVDFDNDDPNDIFTIGILTLEREARFIGDTSQLVCYEGSFGVTNYYNVRKNFGGNFWFYTYETTGDDYEATTQSIRFEGSTFLTNSYLDAYYVYRPIPDPLGDQYWEALLLNYSTSGIQPDVNKLEGTWEIEDSFVAGNTLTLNITAVSTTKGTFTGADAPRGNTIINGEIIEIHYNDPTRNIPATEMYRVSLDLNNGVSTVSLSGLATYIASMTSSGVSVDESLAIGATSSGGTRMLTGIAEKVP